MDRFHKAARDGYLEALKEATRKDLNTRDEDGMTPTLWAAFEGNLDALRLIVGRGGDPDKCDNFGNTALHFSSARGHLNCVTFLVNFGVNMWALDIDFHTPKDLAAINNKDEILRFLDAAEGREEAKDRKKVKAYKEKATKDAEKRVKEFDKIQKKASKSVEEEQKKLLKVRKEMEKNGTVRGNAGGEVRQEPRPSMAFLSLRKDSKLLYGQSPKFSEIVANSQQGTGGSSKLPVVGHYTGVYKKVQQRKTLGGSKAPAPSSDFKVADIESDGRRSVRSLSGLRRDSEIMYVPKYEISSVNNVGKRGKISGLFDEGSEDAEETNLHSDSSTVNNPDENINGSSRHYRMGGTTGKRAGSISGIGLSRSISQPDYMHQVGTDSGFNDDTALAHNTPSIFERPGFGSVAFRNSITSTLTNFPNFSQNMSQQAHHKDSIGSASSLNHASSKGSPWDEVDVPPSDEDEDVETGPVELFLAAAGLSKYIPIFLHEKIDLEALMLLTENDLKSMGIEMGPRRKLLKSISDRQGAMERPGEVVDSRL